MCTTGVVKWFDRRTGLGVLVLDDGGECVVRLVADEGGARCGDPRASQGARHTSWRDDAAAIARAVQAGTWGDGGRDH